MSRFGDPTAAQLTGEVDGAPQVPAQGQEDLIAIKSGALFACLRRDGDIRAGPYSGEGLYVEDTRHLSELRLRVGGAAPVLLSSTMESGHHAVVHATNPTLRRNDHPVVPQETLNVRRMVLVDDRLLYQVRLKSFRPEAVETTLQLDLGADFADVFEVRGVGRLTKGRLLAPSVDGGVVRFGYEGEDGHRRETLVELERAPDEVELHERGATATWQLLLPAGDTVSLTISVAAGTAATRRSRTFAQARSRLEHAHREWEHECARVTTDHELFDRFVEASVRDLHALLMPAPGGELPAAGIPWYVAPFGRDSLLTASAMLMLNSGVARGTLLVLAGLQASQDDPWRDAEPGKILHELRVGELARIGHVPHTPYYGTVDATPLFLSLAAAYHRWTADLETMVALRPAIERALTWIDEWGDRDGDGFVEYERRSAAGLKNQGWKDSHDAIVHADGSLAEGPIALVEVQGYVYEAKRGIAGVFEALGDPQRAAGLRAEAEALRVAFEEAFWMPDEGFYALALDGRKRQVGAVTSNAAHALFTGIAEPARAALVADRLMAPDMFSGWGIRTLSSTSPAYNPMSYHNGSVWPHDNAIAAAGLKRYGLDTATARIATGLFDVAATQRDFRLPELFCGFNRHTSNSIVAYPVACIPQAWAAASPFLLLQALLGITTDAPANWLNVDRPRLPDWLNRLEISGLRVGEDRLKLSFRRESGVTGFSLLDQQGDLRVTMSA